MLSILGVLFRVSALLKKGEERTDLLRVAEELSSLDREGPA